MNTTQLFLSDPSKWQDAQVHLSAMQALFGGWRVYVSGHGYAVIQRISPVTQEQRFRLAFSKVEFQSLLNTCIESDLLTIQPSKRPGYPDETMIQITLVNHRKEYKISSKWAGDKLAEFDAVTNILFELASRSRNAIPYHTGPFDWSVSPLEPP